MSERRQHPRIGAELRVRFSDLGHPRLQREEITRDVSAGGIFISTTVGLPVGTEIALEIDLAPPDRPVKLAGGKLKISRPKAPSTLIKLRAVVVRLEDEGPAPGGRQDGRVRGMGVRFVDADQDILERLIAAAHAATVDLPPRGQSR